MANQIVVSAGAKVRNLDGVLTATSGVVSSVPLGAANGVATLDSGGKVPVSQLPSSVVTYLGTWNAATNTPTLVNGIGDAGDMYLCNVAGTVNFGAGPVTFAVGDWVLYGSGTWQKSNGQNGTVTSVGLSTNGGAITIGNSPITTSGVISANFNGTNLQYVNGAGNLTTFPTLMTSVGLTMPSAFTVTNSPLTGAGGTLAVTGAGTTAQYIRGDGSLATFPTIATEAQRLITEVYNETGATLSKGTVVYINGGHGNLPTITKALATGDATSAQTYGIVQTDITNMNNGYVVVIGSLTDLDTSAYVEGTQLYLSSTTAGAWTSVKQYAPAHLVYVAIVTRSHPTQGVVEVMIQNGFEMDELHNVSAQSPLNNQGLFYNTSTSLWENKSIATALGYTPADDSLVVHLAGTETITGVKNFNIGLTLQTGYYPTPALGYVGLGSNGSGITILTKPVSTVYNNNLQFSAASNTYNFPNATGTLALTSDLASYVTLATTQTITGAKTFSGYTTFTSTVDITSGLTFSNSGFTLVLQPPTLSVNRTVTLPDITGTIAMLEGTQTFSGSKTFTGSATFNNTLGNSIILNYGAALVKGNTPSSTSGVWSNIYAAAGNNNLVIADNANISKLQFQAASTYTYTFPNATGTIALTSDISYPVTSVFGRTGAVVATSGDYTTAQVTEVTNLYFTDSRARLALSAGTGISYNNTTGVITNSAPDQTVALTASTGISVTGTYPNFTITNTSPSSGGTVTSVAALTIGTSGTDLSSTVANSTTTPVITLNVPTASATNRGALSSADWTTFNNKQSALTNPVLASGTWTSGYLPKINGTYTIGNSIIQDLGYAYILPSGAEALRVANDNVFLSFYNSSNTTRRGYIQAQSTALTIAAEGSFMQFQTPSGNMRLDASGNLGLGVTPSAWYTGYTALQIGESAALFSNRTSADTRTTQLSNNAYLNSGATNWIYAQSDEATRYGQVSGEHQWFTAPLGTAGNAISFTQAMTLFANGNLSLGSTVDSGFKTYIKGGSSGLLLSAGSTSSDNALLIQNAAENTTFLTIKGTGAATFSSSVTAGGAISLSNNNVFPSGAGIFQGTGYLQMVSGANGFTINNNANTVTNVMVTNAGNVGIGTTSPAYKLDLFDSSGSFMQLYQNDGTYNRRLIITSATTGGNAGITMNATSSTGGDNFIFQAASIERARITSGGNVLIGTTTDTGHKLRVFGDGASFGNGGDFYQTINSGASGSYYLIVNGAIRQTIASTGAATFSSSVTAGGLVTINKTNEGLILTAGANTDASYMSTRANNSTGWMIMGSQGTTAGYIQSGTGANESAITTVGAYALALGTNQVERMRITSGGNVGIGTTSPAVKFEIAGSGSIGYFRNPSSTAATTFITVINANNTSNGLVMAHISDGTGYFGTQNSADLRLVTGDTERMRITSGGALCLGVTSAYGTNLLNVNGGIYATSSIAAVVAADLDMLVFQNTGATYSKACVVASMTATGGTGSYFFYGQQSTSTAAIKIFSNGNIQNTNNSYGAISDARLKENIKDATPKLDDLMKVKVRNYNLKGESNKQLGVISQELEAIFPNMIEESTNMGENMKIKGVKYSVFVPMLIKAVQEQQQQINELKQLLNK